MSTGSVCYVPNPRDLLLYARAEGGCHWLGSLLSHIHLHMLTPPHSPYLEDSALCHRPCCGLGTAAVTAFCFPGPQQLPLGLSSWFYTHTVKSSSTVLWWVLEKTIHCPHLSNGLVHGHWNEPELSEEACGFQISQGVRAALATASKSPCTGGSDS